MTVRSSSVSSPVITSSRRLPRAVGEVADHAREAHEHGLDRHHPHLHDQRLQVVGDAGHLLDRAAQVAEGVPVGELLQAGALDDHLPHQVHEGVEAVGADAHRRGGRAGGALGGGAGGRARGGRARRSRRPRRRSTELAAGDLAHAERAARGWSGSASASVSDPERDAVLPASPLSMALGRRARCGSGRRAPSSSWTTMNARAATSWHPSSKPTSTRSTDRPRSWASATTMRSYSLRTSPAGAAAAGGARVAAVCATAARRRRRSRRGARAPRTRRPARCRRRRRGRPSPAACRGTRRGRR